MTIRAAAIGRANKLLLVGKALPGACQLPSKRLVQCIKRFNVTFDGTTEVLDHRVFGAVRDGAESLFVPCLNGIEYGLGFKAHLFEFPQDLRRQWSIEVIWSLERSGQ
ncbi:MAG: hypothetical protein C0423_05810 [Methylibium sp.]|nr:hypothetical protein [Methylibium sp.]